MFASKLSEAKRRKISLAPNQSRYGRNDIVLEHSVGQKFRNQVAMEFLKGRRIFAGKDGSRGIGPVFKSGMSFFGLESTLNGSPLAAKKMARVRIIAKIVRQLTWQCYNYFVSRFQLKGAAPRCNRCRIGGGGRRIASRIQIVCAV